MISSESININISNSSRVKLCHGHGPRVASSHSRGVAVCRNWTTSRTTTTLGESAFLLPPFFEPEKKIACAKTLFVAKLNECAFFGAAVSHVENFFDGKHGLERVVRHALVRDSSHLACMNQLTMSTIKFERLKWFQAKTKLLRKCGKA